MHSKDLNKGLEYLKEKFGEDSKIYNTAQSLNNIFTPKMPLRAKQQELLAVIRNSEDNDVLDILKEVAKINPEVNKNLRNMLGLTTANLKSELQKFDINPQDIKIIFDDYTKGTKAAYEEANEKILSKIYDDNYKVVLDSKEFDKFYEETLNNYELPSSFKNVLNSIKHKVYNQKGVTYKDLEATRKSLNNLYSEDKTLDSYLKNFISSHLREDINKGINNIFSQNKEAYKQAKTLYETKLADYAQLKEIQDSTIYKKINNVDNSLEDIAKAILKNAKGAGKIKETGMIDKTLLNNFNELTKGLTEQNRQSLELNLLHKIFQSSLVADKHIKVFNSELFLDTLAQNKEIFKSTGAKEYIQVIKDFNTLFKRDADILSNLPNANPKENNTNIATNISGPFKHMGVSGLFGIIYRNLPHDGLLFGMIFPTMGQGIQKAALKYHLGKALKESSSLENFNFNITQRANRGGFNSPTKELVERIVEQVSEVKEEALRVAKEGREAQEIPQDLKEQWLKEFNLESLEQDFIPSFIPEVKAVLQSIGIDKIQLKSGSLVKLDKRERLEFLPHIKPTLENPDVILKHLDSLIFIKDIGKESFFTSVSKGQNGEMIVRSNSFKTIQNLKNKLNTQGEVLFLNKEASNILTEAFTPKMFSKQLDTNIIPQSPTNQSILDKALKEKQEGIAKEQRLQQEAQQEQAKRASLLNQKRQSIQQAKESNVGKSVNEVELLLSDSIPYTPLRQTSINLENKTYNAKYVIIKKQDLKPNFSNTGTQGRLIKQTRVIEDIQNNLNPNKLFFSEGGFDGLPVILADGSVSVGNHRAEALKNLSKESLQTYKEVAKKAFNVDLRDDEVIVRMLDFDIPKQEILNLSFASNVGREQNIAEKALSTLGKYQEGISKLPNRITASSVEEMQSIVSKTLDTTNNGLNTFDTNLALFTHLAKTRNKSILESLESLKGSAEEKQAALRMFVENAGSFYNISQQTLMPKLDLRDYLAQALYFTATAKESRKQNFQELIKEIEDLLKTTNAEGKNPFIEQNPYYYEDLLGKILGYSFARFKELENPAKNLFEFLENLEPTLRQELEPTLFSNGRAISSADIYDLLSISIKSGIPSKETSELLELLPKLKEKQEGFKGSLEGQILEETPLTYHTEQSKSIAELRTSLKEALSPYVNKDIVNIATNIKAQISSTGINKIASKKAVDKSINNGFSRDEHFKAGENINKLFENATLKSTKADKNQSPHLRAIYRFDSPLLINNKEANALITLKESIENGKKIYSLELEELSPSSNTQRHTNKEEQGQLMLTKVADMQGETLTTPIAKTDTQIIPQSTTSSQSLELIAGFKNQLVQGLSAFFENTNISKASYEKYRLLGVDKFFSDFDIASIHNLGLNKDYSQIYTGTLQNGKHFELEVQKISPSNNSGLNFHQKVIFKIAKGSGEVEKKLEWIRHYYKTSQKDATLFENGISIELNNGEKNKLLNYKQNAKSAKLEIQTQPLQETLEQKDNLLPDDDFKSFLELKVIGDNPRDREYKGENIYNPQRGIYSTLGFDFNSTKEAKAFIDEAQSELTPKEIELLKDSFKEVEIKTNYADYDGRIGKSYPPYIKLNDEKANAILQYKIKSLGFDESNHFLNLFEKYAKNQNEFLKANGEPFGINFKLPESKDKGKLALKVLSDAKMGQVKGAFFREDLKELSGNGEIDLVWGEVTNPQTHKGYGLAHIIDKHPDFDINLIPQIVKRGEVIDDKSALTLWHKGENGEYYKLGISKGFKGDGENHWVITAYEVDRAKDKTFGDTLFTDKHPLPNSNTIIPQSPTNQSLLDKALKEKQEGIIKEQELTTAIKPIDNIQTPTLKEEFATANTSQKISIIERELLKENEALTKEYRELNEIIKNKDYTSFEISEATNFIKTNTKSLGEKYIELINPFDTRDIILIQRGTPKEEAEHFLEWKIRNESLIPISKTINNNKKEIIRLKNDLEFSWSESNKARLEKNLARLEKHLLKQEQEYFKSLSLTYDLNTQEGLEKTKDLFYRANPTQEQIQLFETILPIAKKLGVEVRNAIREPYQRGGNTKHISGIYVLNQNSARVKHSIKEKEKSKTLLHELIHSATSRAMIAYERGATHLLNKEQIQAIENINSLYQQVFKQSDELGLSLQDDYGLTNPHELLAELSNPSFVEKLKKINVFEKLIDNIIQLFVSIKEIAGLKKTNAYDTLKNNVADIIQNYKSDFTQQYNNLKIRNITLNNKDTIQTKPFAYHTQTPKGIASLRADLKEALSPYINKEITNKETGLSGTISIKEINKISSSKAVDKSIYNGFSRDEHFKVSEHLKELFENAHLKQTHTDYKERPNIQAVHRFNTPLSINDKEAVAKITLFEKRLGNNKIYSLELESLSSAPLSKDADNTGAAVKAQLVESPHNKSTTIAKTDDAIIPQLQQKFKYDATKAKDLSEWHKDSSPLTKDEQGLPKVFYHGSKAENLQVFDNSFDSSKWGFWFGTDKDFVLEAFADSNKEQFTQAFLKMKNPLDATKTFDTKTLQELKGIFNLDNKDIALYKSLSKEFANIKKELDKKGFAFVSYGGGLVEAKPLLHKNKDLINELYEEWNILNDKERKGYTKGRAGLIEALQKDLGLFKDDLTLKNIIKYYDTGETLFFNPRELIALNRFDNQAPQALRDIQHLDSELGLLLGMKGKAQYSNINTRELLQAKGYDGIILNDDVSVVFDSNQIKAVENKGSIFNKTSGDFKTATTKDTTKEGFKYFNEQSPNIYHSNPHLGSGLVGGSVAGFETDEQGNLSFNPQNFLLGLAGGAIGSKAVAQGFKALKDNPAFKEKLQQELANTLSRGWESAIKQYPILESLQPRYIIKNERGAQAQAQSILKEVEKREQPKLRTIQAVDNYAQSSEFKALSPDKQQAILSLKDIKPSEMPEGISKADLENLNTHFSSKQDQAQREYYLKLFKDTQEHPHITLETLGKNGEERKEYIKAYQHKEDRDLYYIAITQEKDTINITGYPTTQINKVIGDIKKSKKVAEAFEGIQQTATPLQNNLSPQGANAIIPQKATQKLKEYIEVKEKIANIESMNFGTSRELRQEINKKGIQNLTASQYKKQLRNQYGYDTLLKRAEELQQEINNFTPQEKNPFTLENFDEDLAEQWIDLVERANVFHIRGHIEKLAQNIKYTQALKDIKQLKKADILKSIKGLDDFVIKQRELFDLESRVNRLKSNFQKISKNETRRRMKENNIRNVSIVDYQKILLEQDQDYLEYKKLLPEYEKKAKKIKSLLDYQPFNLKNWNDEAVEKWVVAIKNHPTLYEVDKNRLIHSLPRMTKKERESFERKIANNIQEFLKNGYTEEEINIIKEAALNKNETASIILERYQSVGYGRGYSGYSMSNNAISSYANGEKPISKWNSQDVKEFNAIFGTELTLKEFKDFLLDFGEAGYHHTSSHYNKTTFYSLAEAMQYKSSLLKYFPYAILE